MLESLNLKEVVKYITPGFGEMAMVYPMNLDKWNELPADVQGIIDELFLKYTLRMAEHFDQENNRIINVLS